MRLSSKLRLALPAAVFAVGLATTSVASAATPSATVKPSTKLKNNKVVQVAWKGFSKTKNQYLAIVQCTTAVVAPGGGQNDCDINHPVVIGDGVTKPPAKGNSPFTVHTGAIGVNGGTCGTNSGDKNNCLIVVSGLDGSFQPVANQNAGVPITFK